MLYELAICRLGALTQLKAESAERVAPRDRSDLEKDFRLQRRSVVRSNSYLEALEYMKTQCGGDARFGSTEPLGDTSTTSTTSLTDPHGRDEWGRDIFSMPPPLNTEERKLLGPYIHLVGVLPSERLTCTIGNTSWSIRVRASMTACALEARDGLPKLWWTFEGVPGNPERLLSDKDVANFFEFVSGLEPRMVQDLAKAYFEALSEVTKQPRPLEYELGKERLNIRFADNNDNRIAQLIDALRYHIISPEDIKHSEIESLGSAKDGLREFEHFVASASKNVVPSIDPSTMSSDISDLEVNVTSIEAVTVRSHCAKTIATSIAGVAQRPANHTSLDSSAPTRPMAAGDNDAERKLRSRSPSGRLTAALAGREAVKLELERRRLALS